MQNDVLLDGNGIVKRNELRVISSAVLKHSNAGNKTEAHGERASSTVVLLLFITKKKKKWKMKNEKKRKTFE